MCAYSFILLWTVYYSKFQSCCFIENIRIAVGMLLLSCVRAEMQAEIYVFSYLLPVPDRHLWYITHPNVVLYYQSSHYVVQCSKRYANSLETLHIFHLHCQVQVFPVLHLPFLFTVELWSNHAYGDVAISSVDFGIFKNERINIEFACKGDLRHVIQWSPSLSHFHQKIIHPSPN